MEYWSQSDAVERHKYGPWPHHFCESCSTTVYSPFLYTWLFCPLFCCFVVRNQMWVSVQRSRAAQIWPVNRHFSESSFTSSLGHHHQPQQQRQPQSLLLGRGRSSLVFWGRPWNIQDPSSPNSLARSADVAVIVGLGEVGGTCHRWAWGGRGIPRSEGLKLTPEPGKIVYLLLPPSCWDNGAKIKLCHSQSLLSYGVALNIQGGQFLDSPHDE